ncbi:homeobox protein NANOG, partial [Boleophthalmus pectinirostris]|uniref:homeobox protein NANOG n=1 Tax=Boleophthalmus pectinirostris TaxID=150288 RepID=UPI00242DCA00
MADWKAQINYNYNPSYHAYAYGLMYQPGSEQNQVNTSSWADSGFTDLGNYTSTQGYPPASAAPKSPERSPPESPEPHAYSGHGQYQSTGLVYLGDSEASRLRLTGQTRENEARRTGSDSASDSEPQTSPDSWSCGSSGEGCPPQADPATWAHKVDLDDETSSRSPDSNEDVPNNEEPQTYRILGNEAANITTTSAPLIAPKNQSTTKGKVRASFSESQMNTLAQRFNVQRYLTPAEMKNLSEVTGLTYKQVKTWFQNRRMKLRRHQKDNSWASERYTIKDNTGQGAVFTNLSSHMQSYEGQNRPVLNQQVIEAALKKTATPNLAFYLAAVGGATGSTGYPAWSSNAQNALHGRHQAPSWSLP